MATLTITTTAPQDVRIVAAFGKRLGLGRDATGAEVKAAVVAWLVAAVRDQEVSDAYTAAVSGNTPIVPT